MNIFNWGLTEDIKVLKRVGCSHSQKKNSLTPPLHSVDVTQKCKDGVHVFSVPKKYLGIILPQFVLNLYDNNVQDVWDNSTAE